MYDCLLFRSCTHKDAWDSSFKILQPRHLGPNLRFREAFRTFPMSMEIRETPEERGVGAIERSTSALLR